MSFDFEHNITEPNNKVLVGSPFIKKIGRNNLDMLLNMPNEIIKLFVGDALLNCDKHSWSCKCQLATLSSENINFKYLAYTRTAIPKENEDKIITSLCNKIMQKCFICGPTFHDKDEHKSALDLELNEIGKEFRQKYLYLIKNELNDDYIKCIDKGYKKYNHLLFSQTFIDNDYNFMIILIPAIDQYKQEMCLYIHPFVINLAVKNS